MTNYTLTNLLWLSAGAILVNSYDMIMYIYIYKGFGLYECGRWRQPLPWPFFFDGEKQRPTQKASVNGSCNHGSMLASQSTDAPLKSCLENVGSMSCAQQPLTRDGAMCNSKEAKLASLPILFGVCAGRISF